MAKASPPPHVPTRRILSLSASAFVVLAAEPLFLLVDTAVVGHLGDVPLAGLGAAGAVMTLLAVVGTALEYGTTGRAARFFGAGRRAAAVGEGVQASWLALLIGLAAVAVGQLVAGPVVRVIVGSDGPVAQAAESWLRIAILGLPGILLVLAGNGWMRGVQDTRTPVVIVTIANVLSAAASPLLVYTAGWGLEGSAVANVLAQWTGALLCLRAIRREQVPLRPDRSVMGRQLVISRDLVIRALAFQASYLTAAGAAGRMGAAELAAHQIGMQLWNLIALLLDSFAIAAQALIGAALGGNDEATARSTAWRVTRLGLVAGLVFGGLLAAGWYLVPRIFTNDPDVWQQAHLLWPFLVAMAPIGGVLFALDGVLFGSGDHTFLRTITLIGAFGGYVPIAVLSLVFGWGIAGVWAGLATFIVIRFIGMALRVRSGRWLVLGETR
ncbi:MATE family efflux transporter [Nakamurella sp. YIM 132087]|uniref:MATE family efflux transporter n=1 Tax=Nakamurella alba TaxID=2665158 RepID=A0A7K1FGS8_9ACTN|nr:MATE family efflux transporter [Nakamurella alba]MTD12679.1 MATE family efflux transporter [Nakamurella alba]